MLYFLWALFRFNPVFLLPGNTQADVVVAYQICTKAFSRADLLKRHRANHFEENGTKRRRINSSPGAGRVAHACQACAKARVKCEEAKP
jgi:hypothetical protein